MNLPPEFYRALFEAAGEAMFVMDAGAATIVAANERARRATGYRCDELADLPARRVFGDAVLTQGRQMLSLARKNGSRTAADITVKRVVWDRGAFLIVTAQEADAGDAAAFPTIIGQSEKIRDLCRLVGSVAKSDATVLIQGESGTGKEAFAHAIHFHSCRAGGPFVKVNCAALTETLLESELFGHVKGAFTGAVADRKGRFKQADGGTLLLDEIGCMSLVGQAKLLRVLQEREFEPVGSSATMRVNVRVIATSNMKFEKAVAAGEFREDLYYRLSVCSLSLPPLRERKEDIPLLAEHLLQKHARAMGKAAGTLAPETLAILMAHDWPGNVRELENALEYATIVEKGPVIGPSSLPQRLSGPGGEAPAPSLRDKLNVFERQVLLETLLRANWACKPAAAALGIDARNLSYFLRKHNLSRGVGAGRQ